jgi:hypothetical protein
MGRCFQLLDSGRAPADILWLGGFELGVPSTEGKPGLKQQQQPNKGQAALPGRKEES